MCRICKLYSKPASFLMHFLHLILELIIQVISETQLSLKLFDLALVVVLDHELGLEGNDLCPQTFYFNLVSGKIGFAVFGI